MDIIKNISLKVTLVELDGKRHSFFSEFKEFIPALNYLVNLLSRPGKNVVTKYIIVTTLTTGDGPTVFENEFRDKHTAVVTMAAAFGAVSHEAEHLSQTALKVLKGGEN